LSKPLKVIFAGTPDFAVPSLQALIDSPHQVIAVYTQPDRPAGRGQQLHASPIKQLALQHQLTVYQPQSLKESSVQQQLITLQADIMVVVAYGLILPTAVLNAPRLGCINVHASLLPKLRGAAPIQRAILAGHTQTGVTIMQMDAGLDTGAMLLQQVWPIAATDTGQTLQATLATLGADALLEVLHTKPHPIPQDNAQASYAPKISKQEGLLDWQQTASELERKIRAFNPWPVAFTQLHQQTIRIWRAEVVGSRSDYPPGTIVAVNQQGLDVATGKGILRLLDLQPAAGKRMPAADFCNARKDLLQPMQSHLG